MLKNFSDIEDGDTVILHPNTNNPIHNKPVKAIFTDGYYYCEGSEALDGPDYYWNDVFKYNNGYDKVK